MVAAVLHLHEGAGPPLDRVDHMGGGFPDAHDVVDARLLGVVDAEIRQRAVVLPCELLLVAEHEVDLVHAGKALRIGLRGAAGDDDARLRLLAPCLADRLPGLPHRFGGDRARVEDDHAVAEAAEAGGVCLAAHHLGFIGVEPAAECDDVDRHHAAPCCSRAQTPVAGSKLPENSHSAGPVMMT